MAKEQQEFHVEVIRTSHGYVRVHARTKNEAKKAVESMDKKKMLGFYKHRFEFTNIGGVTKAEPVND